jgi:hypothetical protein
MCPTSAPDCVERGADVCVARRELSVATSRALGVPRLLHLGLTRWRQSYRRLGSAVTQPVVATRPSVATPGALRGALRFVRGGGRGAEPFRLRRPRPHARIQTRLFISSARAFMRDHCAREIANLPELGDGVLHRGGRAIAALASSARASANNADIRLDTAPRARATVIRVRGAREFALLLLDYGRFCRLSGRKHCTLNECGADECR